MDKPQPDPLIRKNAVMMLRNIFEVESLKHYYKVSEKSLATPAVLDVDDLPTAQDNEPDQRKTVSYCKKNPSFCSHRVVHIDQNAFSGTRKTIGGNRVPKPKSLMPIHCADTNPSEYSYESVEEDYDKLFKVDIKTKK